MLRDILRYKITYTLIAINVIVYLFTSFYSHSIVDMNMEVLADMGALFGPYAVGKGEWYRLFSAMFLHAGITHIAMNMFSLYIVGRGVELYFDTKSYISIYLFSGLLGGVVSLYMHPYSVGIGASGAIFGIFGALAGFFLAHKEEITEQFKLFMKDFAIIIGINLLIGFSITSVDVSAHIGGLFVGILGGFLLSKSLRFLLLYNSLMLFLLVVGYYYLTTQYVQVVF